MDKLKIGIPLSENYSPLAGGAFTYTERLLSAIDAYQFDERIEIVFLYLNQKPHRKYQHKEVISYQPYATYTFKDALRKAAITLCKRLNLSSWLGKLEKVHTVIRNEKTRTELERLGIKILFYASPSGNDYNFPFITIHWDNGHLSSYNFPELLKPVDLAWRHHYYDHILPQAFGILTETQAGKKELIHYTNIYPNRIAVMPMFAGDAINEAVSEEQQAGILQQYHLTKNNFLFYPAQFWAHKNHTLLIDAFEIIAPANPELRIVLTGSDKGNLPYIRDYINKKNLAAKISLLGFVDHTTIFTLYKNALSLVMPTFIGPSNMPPLEAAFLNCPVILSDLEGHRELLGDYAAYFDPTNSSDLAEKITDLIAHKNDAPKIFTNKNSFSIDNTVKEFEKYLLSAIPVRNTWK